jgi:hypothetical protein
MHQLSKHFSGQWKNSAKPSPILQLKLQNSFIDQMPTQLWGYGGCSSSTRGRRGRGAARATETNTNWSLTTAEGSIALRGQSPDIGQSSRGRGIVRRWSASPLTGRTRKRQTNLDVGPNKRRSQVMIRGIMLFVGRTRLNPRILEHPLMALRPVMLLKTIVNQILMEWWRA